MTIKINEPLILECMKDIYVNGPCNIRTLSILSLCKYLDNDLFKKFEPNILLSMGLFYKNIITEVNDSNFPFAFYNLLIKEEFNELLTPIQADIKYTIQNNNTTFFSAPTSIGKSHLLREEILNDIGDVAIIVPTRALLNEYIKDIKKELKNRNVRNINVLPFLERINLLHSVRNIYVLTPERCMDLLKTKPDISLFVIDEAQLIDSSEGIRSLKFRSVINNINKHYKKSKKIYAYPFVENIEEMREYSASFSNAAFKTYKQRGVGQMFVNKTAANLFHVLDENGDYLYKNIGDPVINVLTKGGRVLIFCDKAKIYSGSIYKKMEEYISLCKLNATENNLNEALLIIKKIEDKLGTSPTVTSQLVENLKKGVAIHHGSLPHEIRLLIENFINQGFSQICFATPTLEQGINLPFDLIYIDSFGNISNSLDLKNLIGRAGRSDVCETYDYGIVVFKNKNLFYKYFNEKVKLDFKSDPSISEDEKEMKDAILKNGLDEETNLPKEALVRISDEEVMNCFERCLSGLFDVDGSLSKNIDKKSKKRIVEDFCLIYKSYLRGREIGDAERRVFFESVYLMIDKIQKKKFSQIVNERYSFAKKRNWKGLSKFVQLPNRSPGFEEVLTNNIDDKYYFDIIAYDTFEYLDKNYNLYLKDIFYATAYMFEKSILMI